MGGEASKVLLPPFSLPFANAFRVRWDARVKALGSMLTKRPSWTLMYPPPRPLSHHLLADTRRIVVTSGRGGGRGTIEEKSLLSGWVINLYHLFNKQRQAKLINCANKRATIVETRLRCVVRRACVRACVLCVLSASGPTNSWPQIKVKRFVTLPPMSGNNLSNRVYIK